MTRCLHKCVMACFELHEIDSQNQSIITVAIKTNLLACAQERITGRKNLPRSDLRWQGTRCCHRNYTTFHHLCSSSRPCLVNCVGWGGEGEEEACRRQGGHRDVVLRANFHFTDEEQWMMDGWTTHSGLHPSRHSGWKRRWGHSGIGLRLDW